jgi:hypothetical protein
LDDGSGGGDRTGHSIDIGQNEALNAQFLILSRIAIASLVNQQAGMIHWLTCD